MTNLTQTILQMATGVVPLVPIVMALVQQFKKITGTSDERWLNGASMLFGVLFGGGFMLAAQVPSDFAGWFLLVVYGILLGLTASGLFNVGQQLSASEAVKTTVADRTHNLAAAALVAESQAAANLSIVKATTALAEQTGLGVAKPGSLAERISAGRQPPL